MTNQITAILCLGTACILQAQTFTTLATFDGANGANPYAAALVQGTDGNFYGTTSRGGAYQDGTIFKITPSGELTTLHSFSGSDGFFPTAALFLASDGNFYGTTTQGGAYKNGTVFRFTPDGVLTVLHSFHDTDGRQPAAPLIQGTDGILYGTTSEGGSGTAPVQYGWGTIFKIALDGTFTSLYSFFISGGVLEGIGPYGVIQAKNGSFYGTTAGGGLNDGTLFKMTPAGVVTTIYSFGTNAENTNSGVIQGADGKLYGTSFNGSALGSVFSFTPGGTVALLHSFDGTDGDTPFGVIQASNGSFYGVTLNSTNGYGTIYEIDAAGAFSTEHRFNGAIDGASPWAPLLEATDGYLYGTTYEGGAHNHGTVFKLSVGLAPSVKPVPASGSIGTPVMILGTRLSGATSVSFNGVAADFTAVSATEITTVVPAGASSGKIEVVTPAGRLYSVISPFQVLP
jgi:uncharacterized repeat protein (TIGR03803 family)